MPNLPRKVLALSGGVGGAKLALGLANVLPAESLTVVCNTGDDFEHLGLHIAPDLDTVMYTLAGVANPETGWGRAGETWSFMEALAELGEEAWFQLGDRDLATHIERTVKLSRGQSLTEATQELCSALGIRTRIVPMTDDPVRTVVDTDCGELPFQIYFVREQCKPKVRSVRFEGADQARPAPVFLTQLEDPELDAVVICPSNPYLSVDPILELPGVVEALKSSPATVIAVSPIVGGKAVKGPAAKIMTELGVPSTAFEVAKYYQDRSLLDVCVFDQVDGELEPAIGGLGLRTLATQTIMTNLEDKEALAKEVLNLLGQHTKDS